MRTRKVTFIDTSVFCNLLPVPGRDQDRSQVLKELLPRQASDTLILPVTTIIETGNLIAQLASANLRRSTAARLVETLRLIRDGRAPWALHEFAWDQTVIEDLIDGCGTGRALHIHAESKVGVGDLAILAEMRSYARRVQYVTVDVWTLDTNLGTLASHG